MPYYACILYRNSSALKCFSLMELNYYIHFEWIRERVFCSNKMNRNHRLMANSSGFFILQMKKVSV